MTTKELVNNLMAKGHAVSVYHRPDGGIRITAIDGKKYKGSAGGNQAARQILGVSLSAKQKAQRSEAGRASVKGHKLEVTLQQDESPTGRKRIAKAESITKQEKAYLRKYNKIVKKLKVTLYEYTGGRKKGKAQKIAVTRISTEYFRKGKTRFGSKGEMQKLRSNLLAAIGFADTTNVDLHIAMWDRFPKSKAYLEENKFEIEGQALEDAHDVFYDMDKAHKYSDEQIDDAILAILEAGTKRLKETIKAAGIGSEEDLRKAQQDKYKGI